MSRSRITVAALLVATVGAAGCSDSSPPTVPSDQPDDPSLRPAGQGTPMHPNDLARDVKGFGGFFLDEQGVPTIYLKDAAQKENAGRALGRYFQAAGINPSQLRVVRGQFDWNELERWFELASGEVLALPGTVFADADEANNRVTIGIERGSGAHGSVRSAAARLGIPADALLIQEMEPVRFAATLRDNFSSKVGGIQINFPGFLCTLGFNAREGTGPASFITNSHCTNTQGGVESTPYWQPLQSTHPTQIATEREDPDYRRNLESRCPKGKRCRYSDASRAEYAGGIAFSAGTIAKTTGPNNSSLTTATSSFSITSKSSATNFTVGTTVNKVGRTTGWTQGRVSNTCVTTGVSGTNVAQICQTFVQAGVGGGDSGSPVFIITGGDNVTLAGILWGGSGSTLFVFSPLANIEREIGTLTVTN